MAEKKFRLTEGLKAAPSLETRLTTRLRLSKALLSHEVFDPIVLLKKKPRNPDVPYFTVPGEKRRLVSGGADGFLVTQRNPEKLAKPVHNPR